MAHIKQFAKKIILNKAFEIGIIITIIINALLIGVETYGNFQIITAIQSFILLLFTIEIIIRLIAADSLKVFFTSGWNIFDLILVIVGYLPETLFPNASAMMALRVLRVFRVLRLLRASKEVKLIVTVLVKSMSSMFYNLILFLVFIYLFSIIGVGMFRMPDPATLSGEDLMRYEQLVEIAPNSPSNSSDPYGSLGEAMFTLFRALTGEDWTDLRYNLVTACELGVLPIYPSIVTVYHVVWFCLSAFLLLNLVTGAVINNYQVAIEEDKEKKDAKK